MAWTGHKCSRGDREHHRGSPGQVPLGMLGCWAAARVFTGLWHLLSLKRAKDEQERKLQALNEVRAAAQEEASELRARLQEWAQAQGEAHRELQECRIQVRTMETGIYSPALRVAKLVSLGDTVPQARVPSTQPSCPRSAEHPCPRE